MAQQGLMPQLADVCSFNSCPLNAQVEPNAGRRQAHVLSAAMPTTPAPMTKC